MSTSVAATAGLAASTLLSAPQREQERSIDRGAVPAFELDELTIAQLQDGLAAGKWTSRSLVEKYLARIAMIDQTGPELRSILELNPEALAIADSLDEERKRKGPRGPLHGIPILLKDNINTGDRMLTTAGSLALTAAPASRDAAIVERLRNAGAVILGKTNLSEWANIRSTKSTSGWSARGGRAKNPYALDRNTSGSSSGSGAAIAANLAAVAIGTETDGSIVSPAGSCSLVGIKPTVGLVSRNGIIPISHSQDTAGPMARTVADAAVILTVIAGSDPDDDSTKNADSRKTDYTKSLQADGLKGARLGIVKPSHFGLSAKLDPILKNLVDALKNQGAVVVDDVEIPHLGEYDNEEFDVLLYEFKHDLAAYLATRSGIAVKTLADVISFNDRNRDAELPYFGQEIFLSSQEKGPLSEKKYLDARAKSLKLAGIDGIDAALRKNKLDALVTLTNGPAWLADLVNGDHYSGGFSSPPAVSGYPHITVPAGYLHGLPIGASFFGTAWSEAALIRYAYSFEQATKIRKAPLFLPTVRL